MQREKGRKGALASPWRFREGDERTIEAGRKGGRAGTGDSKRRYRNGETSDV